MNNKSFSLQRQLVIAHRGTTYWAPEETEAAMRWARNTGADYLEFDLQRTKDGQLIALHDDKLLRTTDVALKFPEKKDLPVSAFTYEELLRLDAGSWFNTQYPERARSSFSQMDILCLEDIINIAEGRRIKRDAQGKRVYIKNASGSYITQYEKDPADTGDRPGIYVETKVPSLFPNIEEDLKAALIRMGWYSDGAHMLKAIPTGKGKVDLANTSHRVVLQTFSKQSLAKLHEVFGQVPICFLLWRGTEPDDLPDEALDTYEKWVQYAREHGATHIGPSIAGWPNDYVDLLTAKHMEIIHKYSLQIHAYSFDTAEQMQRYGDSVDGMFTNRAELTLKFYKKSQDQNSPQQTLDMLGYR